MIDDYSLVSSNFQKLNFFFFLLLDCSTYSIIFLVSSSKIGKYYFSDVNKKNSYRSFKTINEKINIYSKKLPILEDDTKNIIEYIEQSNNKKKKKFNFWKLLEASE